MQNMDAETGMWRTGFFHVKNPVKNFFRRIRQFFRKVKKHNGDDDKTKWTITG